MYTKTELRIDRRKLLTGVAFGDFYNTAKLFRFPSILPSPLNSSFEMGREKEINSLRWPKYKFCSIIIPSYFRQFVTILSLNKTTGDVPMSSGITET